MSPNFSVLTQLNPSIVYDRTYQGDIFLTHTLKKCHDENYQKQIPVAVCNNDHDIAVEIDSWSSERELSSQRLSQYGQTRLKDLLGEEAFHYLQMRRSHLFPYFFGNHFFPHHLANAAIRLANFAAVRDQNDDFPKWFE